MLENIPANVLKFDQSSFFFNAVYLFSMPQIGQNRSKIRGS